MSIFLSSVVFVSARVFNAPAIAGVARNDVVAGPDQIIGKLPLQRCGLYIGPGPITKKGQLIAVETV